MARRRLRNRLDSLEAQASQTMSGADQLIAAGRALLEEVEDGFTLELVRDGSATIMDFLMGKVDTLPIKVRVCLGEPVDGDVKE